MCRDMAYSVCSPPIISLLFIFCVLESWLGSAARARGMLLSSCFLVVVFFIDCFNLCFIYSDVSSALAFAHSSVNEPVMWWMVVDIHICICFISWLVQRSQVDVSQHIPIAEEILLFTFICGRGAMYKYVAKCLSFRMQALAFARLFFPFDAVDSKKFLPTTHNNWDEEMKKKKNSAVTGTAEYQCENKKCLVVSGVNFATLAVRFTVRYLSNDVPRRLDYLDDFIAVIVWWISRSLFFLFFGGQRLRPWQVQQIHICLC